MGSDKHGSNQTGDIVTFLPAGKSQTEKDCNAHLRPQNHGSLFGQLVLDWMRRHIWTWYSFLLIHPWLNTRTQLEVFLSWETGKRSLPCLRSRDSDWLNGVSTAINWRGEVSQPDNCPPLVLQLFFFSPVFNWFFFFFTTIKVLLSITHNSESFMTATHHPALIKQFWHSKYFVILITASLFVSYSFTVSRLSSDRIWPRKCKSLSNIVCFHLSCKLDTIPQLSYQKWVGLD